MVGGERIRKRIKRYKEEERLMEKERKMLPVEDGDNSEKKHGHARGGKRGVCVQMASVGGKREHRACSSF